MKTTIAKDLLKIKAVFFGVDQGKGRRFDGVSRGVVRAAGNHAHAVAHT